MKLEPSTAVVSHLIDFTREQDIPVVFYLELSSGKIARIISEDSSAKDDGSFLHVTMSQRMILKTVQLIFLLWNKILKH